MFINLLLLMIHAGPVSRRGRFFARDHRNGPENRQVSEAVRERTRSQLVHIRHQQKELTASLVNLPAITSGGGTGTVN